MDTCTSNPCCSKVNCTLEFVAKVCAIFRKPRDKTEIWKERNTAKENAEQEANLGNKSNLPQRMLSSRSARFHQKEKAKDRKCGLSEWDIGLKKKERKKTTDSLNV